MKLVLETDSSKTALYVATGLRERGFTSKVTTGVNTLFRVWGGHSDDSFARRLWPKLQTWTIGDGEISEELR